MLESTKPAVLAEKAKREAAKVNPEPFLLKKSGQLFYNTSPLDLKKLVRHPNPWVKRGGKMGELGV